MTKKKIFFNDLYSQNSIVESLFINDVKKILKDSSFILGQYVEKFENDFSVFCKNKYAVGVSCGTDAIKLCIKVLEPDKKTLIITQANTFIATAIAIKDASSDSTMLLTDIDKFYQMDMSSLEDILHKNRNFYDKCIVVPVSMYGHTFDKDSLIKLKNKFSFEIVEDCSQSHGSQFSDGTLSGTVGICAAYSLYPGKNLGAIGDAGVTSTNSKRIYNKLKKLRNYGSSKKYIHDIFGYNTRLDSIQAAFLIHKLKYINKFNKKRNNIGVRYINEITSSSIKNFKNANYCSYNTFHVYPIRINNRKKFINYLDSLNIQWNIHYPIPIEKTKPFLHYNFYNPNTRKIAKQIISLPIHPFMEKSDIDYIIENINYFNI